MRTYIKFLVGLSALIALATGLFPQTIPYLALSYTGLKKFYFWQLISYCFVQPGPISFSFFIEIIFYLYLLWTFGLFLIERIGSIAFSFLFFGSVLLSSTSVFLFPRMGLAGLSYPVYAILIHWMILNPQAKLYLFFSIPFQASTLIGIFLGISLFIDLSQGYWIGAIALVITTIYSYLFALIRAQTIGPFAFLHPFEKKVIALLQRKKRPPSGRGKIYDFETQEEILSDDQFMDAMLDRIARHGESSLTKAEKKRMQEISEKRKKK